MPKKRKKSVLILTDNIIIFEGFKKILRKRNIDDSIFDYRCSFGYEDVFVSDKRVKPINIKENIPQIVKKYDFILYLHGRQIVPKEIIDVKKCLNIHPGFNPHNRGMFPHIFSMMNGLPAGATLHEMDEFLDHGPIIDQIKLKIKPEDTSQTLYRRCIAAEFKLLDKYIKQIVNQSYKTKLPQKEGNMNKLKDYNALKEIDLNKKVKTGDFINYLRAFTHKGYNNAYFIDQNTGDKIYVSIKLKRERSTS